MEKLIKQIRLVKEVPGETNSKKWLRYEFEFTDGFKVSTFDDKIGKAFNPGQTVEIAGDKEGQFWKLKSMVVSEQGNITPEVERVIESPVVYSREASIIAQTMTKCWAMTRPVDVSKEDVLEAYRWFLNELN